MSNFLKENKFSKTGPRGIIHTQGHHWMTQRRFSLKTLKDFGFGRKSLENAITTEIDLINEEFLSKEVCINSSLKFYFSLSPGFWRFDWSGFQHSNNQRGSSWPGYRFGKDNKNVNNVTEIFQEGIKIHMIPMFLLKVSTFIIAKIEIILKFF